MANESASESSVETESVGERLARLAAERDLPTDALVEHLLDVAEATETDDDADLTTAGDRESLERRIDELEAELDRQIADLDETYYEMLEDVRDRVIQVKRETDAKAPADHDHAPVRQLADDIDDLANHLDVVEDRFERGFENYESVLEYLTETVDGLHDRLATLACAVIDIRDQLDRLAEARARQAHLRLLTETANANGVRRARCAACAQNVDLSLLVEPRCPHCRSVFSELEVNTGFFRTSRLHTDDAPALESGPDDRPDLESFLEDRGASNATGSDTAAGDRETAASSGMSAVGDVEDGEEPLEGDRDSDDDGTDEVDDSDRADSQPGLG